MLNPTNRLLTASDMASAGVLVDYPVTDVADLLRPWSIVISGGVTVQGGLSGNVTVPKETAEGITIKWQAEEDDAAQPGQPTVASAALTPKTAYGTVRASRNFMLQTSGEVWLKRLLRRVAGIAVDNGVLHRDGLQGRPLGILRSPSISSQSGTSLTYAGISSMKLNASRVNAADSSISFLATPGVRSLLEQRPTTVGGSQTIWHDGKVCACPGYASTTMPGAGLLCGPLGGVLVGLWADLELTVNPYAPQLFASGFVEMRIAVAMDCAIVVPNSAFTYAQTVT